MKLLILLCLKYLGKTSCWNLLISLMMNSHPDGDQYVILLYSSFYIKQKVPLGFRRSLRWNQPPRPPVVLRVSETTFLIFVDLPKHYFKYVNLPRSRATYTPVPGKKIEWNRFQRGRMGLDCIEGELCLIRMMDCGFEGMEAIGIWVCSKGLKLKLFLFADIRQEKRWEGGIRAYKMRVFDVLKGRNCFKPVMINFGMRFNGLKLVRFYWS